MKLREIGAVLLVLIALIQLDVVNSQEDLENEANNYLDVVNKEFNEVLKKQALANWHLEVLDQLGTIGESVKAEDDFSAYVKRTASILAKYDKIKFKNKDIERQIKRFPKPGYDALANDDLEAMNAATFDMASIFQNVKLCSFRERSVCNLTLVPDIQDILHSTNDIDEIKFYWVKWRTATGQRNRESFLKFVELYKKSATLNNFTRPSEMWFKDFDDDNIIDETQELVQKAHPLFLQFHAHVRYLLQQKYGSNLVKSNQPYPLHLSEILLGEAFRYQEDGFVDLPYPQKLIPNVTEELIRQNYSPKKMFDASQKFYESIGFPKLQETFWNDNVEPIANTDQRVLTCVSQAWQTFEKYKVRFSYCPHVDFRRYLNTHQAMSDIYYYQLYQFQPTIYQSEPLPNFDDILSQPLVLSLSSAKYLEKAGLIGKDSIDNETRINRLYLKGMETVFLLPILYVLDKYRIQILNDEISTWDNCKYWKLTEKYTGSVPPVERSNKDFDAPAKLLTAVDAEYSSHILSTIMQYQVFKSFCERVGEYVPGDPSRPLDNCDLSGHPEIGSILSKAMAIGSSKSWRHVLQVLTGEENINIAGYLEYFSPLLDWLTKNNAANSIQVGWEESASSIVCDADSKP